LQHHQLEDPTKANSAITHSSQQDPTQNIIQEQEMTQSTISTNQLKNNREILTYTTSSNNPSTINKQNNKEEVTIQVENKPTLASTINSNE
jgi:hypothetical protein